jgi:hypothetical protein
LSISAAEALDEAMYPNWKGQWTRRIVPGLGGQPSFDQTKPWGFGQQAPLTPEYTKVLADSLADQAKGGQGNHIRGFRALPEKNDSDGIPLQARIGFKNRTGRQASMRWGSRIRICVSG